MVSVFEKGERYHISLLYRMPVCCTGGLRQGVKREQLVYWAYRLIVVSVGSSQFVFDDRSGSYDERVWHRL